jgi:hypothetical protein
MRTNGLAAIPMPHVDESIAEIGRALDELGMVGVVMNTTVLGHWYAETFDTSDGPNRTAFKPFI